MLKINKCLLGEACRIYLIFISLIIVLYLISIIGVANSLNSSTLYYLGNISGNYTEAKIDSNQDGQYDFLAIEIDVNVEHPEEYSIMGSLFDRYNNEVVWAIDHKTLRPGHNTMELDFDGKTIRRHGVNGPYQLRSLKLIVGSSHEGLGVIDSIPVAYNTSFYNASDFADPLDANKVLSGVGQGEFIINITIKKSLPVFSGKYSFDMVGINIPPISSEFNVSSSSKGYTYDLEGIFLPNKPNNFTVSAREVKNLNVGLKKLQGSYENSSMVWAAKYSRIWVTAQISADKKGIATAESDLISPGSYHAKIFGEAADNATAVDLTMSMVKKIFLKGKFNLSINTTGFPVGNYSIEVKALNGSINLDKLKVDGLSIDS